MKRVYLDNASTTPIDPKVLGVMLPYLTEKYGNPSSIHYEGRLAKKAIEESRERIAKIVGVKKEGIIFTSGGTESDNLAILGIARANKEKGKHIIVSAIEHKAVLDSCKKLEKEGFEITYLNVDKNGIVSLEFLKKSIRKDTILVSIMYANNEIGTIQPIKEISKIIKESKIANPIFHTDACQAVGALPININDLNVDALTISSSKIYGPKGVGCLYLNKNCKIEPIIFGGGQERGIRSGTENTAYIVGFAEALFISEKKRLSENKRLTKLRDYFIENLIKKIPKIIINGDRIKRLPNNINLSLHGVEGESFILMLDNSGISCSTGSACSSSDLKPSHVISALGGDAELAHSSIRFTLGRYSTKKDINYVVR
ncbi:MAG: cysteine desulfurase family protein [Candidatus Taylorbacteria bacterium]|nr:cysteine desulfurase family protein [Candidatus Taylorbacteria bacterium]